MVMNLGIIGYNKYNGHPYSFSAIINGYDKNHLIKSGWKVINQYLSKRKKSEFGIKDVLVSHVWTQDLKYSKSIAKSSFIPNICKDIDDMVGKVDGVIIARDDWKSHLKLSRPFLKKGIKVFIDKPLTLSSKELVFFSKYLKNGTLMSCSGLRFATELQKIKKKINPTKTKLIIANIHNDLNKYGIHMLEAVFSLGKGFNNPQIISKLPGNYDHYYLKFDSGVELYLNCLHNINKTINLKIFNKEKNYDFDLFDNFGAFKRTLKSFTKLIDKNYIEIDPKETISLMNIIIKASKLKNYNLNNLKYD